MSKVTIRPGPSVKAVVDCRPDTLNVKNKGEWFKCFIELPTVRAGVFRVRPNTVRLNGTVPALSGWKRVGDFDSDGEPDVQVRFARSAVDALLAPGKTYTVTVSGKLWIRTFSGSDTVKVISRGK